MIEPSIEEKELHMELITWLKSWTMGVVNIASYRLVPFFAILVVGAVLIKIIMTIVNRALKKSNMEKAA